LRLICLRFAAALLACLALAACSHDGVAKTADPVTQLQSIPAADSAKYEHIKDMKNWRNPYLIVRTDGVALFDVADSAEIILKNEELLPALAKLPASQWPYGRVVAAAEGTVNGSEQDKAALRKNKGIVGGMLESAHIAVTWVPAT
jgi:hypothetical protein